MFTILYTHYIDITLLPYALFSGLFYNFKMYFVLQMSNSMMLSITDKCFSCETPNPYSA